MYSRILDLIDAHTDSVFLWGARQTGKSTLLKNLFPNHRYYDLLKSEEFERLNRRPELLRQELMTYEKDSLIIIDEVQKVPQLLDEVHWLITNKNLRFVLCGSSARKLKRSGTNLLGGRAVRNILFPFVSAEIPDFNLERALNNGMLPRHYMVENPRKRIQAYIGDYLQEEIKAEALTRNLSTFNRFLEIAALSSGEMINYQNIATECGVSAPTVKEYFAILSDTMLGYMIPAFRKVMKRKVIHAPRFFYFDPGITNYLLKRNKLTQGSPEYGKAFEQFVVLELLAYSKYRDTAKELSYWRTKSGFEVDLILGDAELAIEIKSSKEIHSHHLKGLRAFGEEYPQSRRMIISHDPYKREIDGIELYPIMDFLKLLWNDQIV